MHKSFEITLINISKVRLSDSAIWRYWTIASLYQKFIVFTVQHKHEQKDKTKTLVKFPDHVFIDFGSTQYFYTGQRLVVTKILPKKLYYDLIDFSNAIKFRFINTLRPVFNVCYNS